MSEPLAASAKRAPIKATEIGAVYFGDDEVLVHEYSDGMYSLSNAGHQTTVNEDQMKEIVGLFHGIGKAKGWL